MWKEFGYFFFGSVLSSKNVTSYLASISVLFFFGIFCAFEFGSCSIVQTGLKPVILLP